MKRGIPWFSKFMSKNFGTLGPFSFSNIHAVGNLEKLSIAGSKYILCLFCQRYVHQNQFVFFCGSDQHTVYESEIA